MVVRKWFNIKNGTNEFHSDLCKTKVHQRGEGRRKSCSDGGLHAWQMEANGAIGRPGFKQLPTFVTNKVNLSIVVGTWNVGGKSPHDGLNLSDWLHETNCTPADIYVLGFQEIVPLNAGNVLGPQDCGPAAKWLSLILQALNTTPEPEEELHEKPRISLSDLMSSEEEFSSEGQDSNSCSSEDGLPSPGTVHRKYCLAASKQMVGIFLCVFVDEDLCEYISGLRISCIGRGILGCLGNKGSVSISMSLHGTTFCFVCTHLASGEKESDAMRRNLDVLKILDSTNFSDSPSTILGHDNIIWLGDLNYRLASISEDTYELLRRKDWQALLEKDQLKMEQKSGRVFDGWKEGQIYFAPTYKYLANSDHYVVQTSSPKHKRRTPAWCDRILWKGQGLKQVCYVRGESRFSDHRPVYSLFLASPNKMTSKITLSFGSSSE
ncbi:type I inositol polyphosphate 5-phosphatase 8-like isoform X4 [Primulina huaijiensis]|uniref:type I inositol polyphosphate 5-phosphatase 8-like isoform X4 n=1 Tax=Primulina huaijiensis TaxID=1492673 RepID=UPI003CC75871